jgi:Flp pilus assembly protein TadD
MNQIPPKYTILICVALTLTTVAVFYQVHGFTFISYDDNVYVYDNPNIQSGFTADSIKWAFAAGRSGNWLPLTWLSYMLDWELWGSNSAGYHITNLIFHIANTLLLFIVLVQMTKALWQSVFVAALFALHPLHVESVAWIAERKDVLSTFFWMLTMWAYLRFVSRPNRANYLLVILFFALGLMSKPMVVTLPFVLLLLDYWPLGRIPDKQAGSRSVIARRLIYEKVPLFILSAASCVVALLAQRGGQAVMPTALVPAKILIANALVSYAAYIGKMFWPSRLAVFYPYPVWSLTVWSGVAPLLLLLAISAVVILHAGRRRYLLTGWLWYLGTLLPVIGLVQVGSQSMADRYTYVPLVGLFIIIAWGSPDLLGKLRYKRVALGVCGLSAAAALSICTHFQLRYWQNNVTLFQHAAEVTQKNHIAHLHLAEALYRRGRLPQAVQEFKKFVTIIPDDPNVLNKLGATLLQEGKLDEGSVWLEKALQIDPNYADAHANLGYALRLQGNLDGALVQLEEAVRLNPELPAPHFHLGHVLARMGRTKQAVAQFEEALRLMPDSAQCMNDLAWFLATAGSADVRDADRATELARRACELTAYKKPDLLDTLAAAYAADGKFSKAIETSEKALELCNLPEQNALKEQISSRLTLYNKDRPYIEGR